MVEEHKDYKLKSGNILRVIQDPNSESPDIWENEDVFLVYDHRQFNIKREGFKPKDIFNVLTLEYPNEPIREDFLDDEGYECAMDEYQADFDDCNSIKGQFANYYIFPVNAYIHSGISLSLEDSKYPFNNRFDVSNTGYVLVKKDVEIISGRQFISEETAKENAESLIETWNQYLSGDVWEYQILKEKRFYKIAENDYRTGLSIKDFREVSELVIEYEEIDACYGFYGSDIKTNGMLDNINDEIIEEDDN